MAAPLCGTSHNAKCWLCTDTCGLVCASLTFFLIVFSMYTMTNQVMATVTVLPGLHVVAFNAVGVMAVVSHLKAMLSDPGAVPKNAEPLPGDSSRLKEAMAQGASHRKRAKGFCHRCMAYKPPRAHHCNVTGRCVVKLDHYCPWTNNAIGVRNHKFFLLFILYTFLLCVYALALLVHMLYAAMKVDGPDSIGLSALVVGVCGLLFGLFTSCMLCDQWSVLSTNVAKIDRLKGEELGVSSEVNEVFGGRTRGFHWHWLVPVTVDFPKSVQDDVLGYRLPTPKPPLVDVTGGDEETKTDADIESGIIGDAPLDNGAGGVNRSPSTIPLLPDDASKASSLTNRAR